MPHQHDRRRWNVHALLESMATPFALAEYRPRATIFRQGDPSNSVMYLVEGRVWLAMMARSGKEGICGVLGTGAFLGEEALVGRPDRPQSAIAMTATQMLVVAKADMSRLLRTQPDLLDRFMTHLFARNSRLQANLTDQLLHSSEERLAHILLALANCDARCPRRCALPDLPQEIVAEMVGTTRSRVSTFMGKFKKRGFLDENNGVLYVNPARARPLRRSRIAFTTPPRAPATACHNTR